MEPAQGLVAAAPQRQVDDQAVVDSGFPLGVNRVAQADARLDEVDSAIRQDAQALGQVFRQEAIVAVEEEEYRALGRADARVTSTRRAARSRTANGLPRGPALCARGHDLGGLVGGAVVHNDHFGLGRVPAFGPIAEESGGLVEAL